MMAAPASYSDNWVTGDPAQGAYITGVAQVSVLSGAGAVLIIEEY